MPTLYLLSKTATWWSAESTPSCWRKTAFTRKYTARNFRKTNGRQFVARLSSIDFCRNCRFNLSEFSLSQWFFVEKNFLPRRHSVFSFSGASVAVRRIRFPQLLRLFPEDSSCEISTAPLEVREIIESSDLSSFVLGIIRLSTIATTVAIAKRRQLNLTYHYFESRFAGNVARKAHRSESQTYCKRGGDDNHILGI